MNLLEVLEDLHKAFDDLPVLDLIGPIEGPLKPLIDLLKWIKALFGSPILLKAFRDLLEPLREMLKALEVLPVQFRALKDPRKVLKDPLRMRSLSMQLTWYEQGSTIKMVILCDAM